MKFTKIKSLLLAVVFLSSINGASASIITLEWDTSVTDSNYPGISIGDSSTIQVRFNSVTNSLVNVVLNAANFLDMSYINNTTGAFVTFNAPGNGNELEVYSANMFEFDSAGTLASAGEYGIGGEDYETNLGPNRPFALIFIDGTNWVVGIPDFGVSISLADVLGNQQASNWTATVSVNTPTTITLITLGMFGLALRKFKKQS